MKENAAILTMKLLMSFIPNIAAIVIFVDLPFKFKGIKVYAECNDYDTEI